jgi:basic membrane lipoprotein Med (substrate-binding protein (PBP1-ABC) superfamily)
MMVRFIFGLFLLFLFACSDSESVGVSEKNSGIAKITLIASINGIGDNSYNDQILAGLFRLSENHGVPFRLIQPESIDEADSLVKSWLKKNADTDSSLLILASSEYMGLAQKLDAHFTGMETKSYYLKPILRNSRKTSIPFLSTATGLVTCPVRF